MMKVKDKLIRIPLQFFGESNDDFDDDLDYEDDEYSDGSDEDGEDEADAEDGEGAEEDPASDESGEAEIISELKAAGYVGNDLSALAADMKKKREQREQDEATEERRAAMKESKGHIKAGKPGKGASGSSMEGFTERDIAEVNACLKHPGEKSRARDALERISRANTK